MSTCKTIIILWLRCSTRIQTCLADVRYHHFFTFIIKRHKFSTPQLPDNNYRKRSNFLNNYQCHRQHTEHGTTKITCFSVKMDQPAKKKLKVNLNVESDQIHQERGSHSGEIPVNVDHNKSVTSINNTDDDIDNSQALKNMGLSSCVEKRQNVKEEKNEKLKILKAGAHTGNEKDAKGANSKSTSNKKGKQKVQKVAAPDSFFVGVVGAGSGGAPCSVVISTTFSR